MCVRPSTMPHARGSAKAMQLMHFPMGHAPLFAVRHDPPDPYQGMVSLFEKSVFPLYYSVPLSRFVPLSYSVGGTSAEKSFLSSALSRKRVCLLFTPPSEILHRAYQPLHPHNTLIPASRFTYVGHFLAWPLASSRQLSSLWHM